jgi:hypothetical protein
MFMPAKIVTVTGFACASIAAPTAAGAAVTAPSHCPPETNVVVREEGSPRYATLASSAGKYNASSTPSNMQYALTTTTERSTTWSIGGTASVSWGIAKIEASTRYDVTDKVGTGRTVTDILNVPGRSYGYVTPTVEYRYFHIVKETDTPKCTTKVTQDYGVVEAITAVPFFRECVAKGPCTP